MNKHALISFGVDCIYKFEQHQKQPLNCNRLIELCLVVAWLSSHNQFHTILVKEWLLKDIPEGNLAEAYAEAMLLHSGCSGGDCLRFQPHFNKPFSKGELYRSLIYLHSIAAEINSTHLSSDNQMIACYEKAVCDIKTL